MLLLSDLHFGHLLPVEVENHILQAAIAEKDHIVLISGDITTNSKEEEYLRAERFFNSLYQNGIIIAATPGNHDFGGPAAELLHAVAPMYERARSLLERLFVPIFNQPQVLAHNAEYFDMVLQVGNNVFFCIKSQHRSGPRIKKCQLKWAADVMRTLPENPDRHLYFMCHHSLWQDASDHHDPMTSRERVEQFLADHKFYAFIHGHNHRFTYQNTTTPKIGYRLRRVAVPTACIKNREWERGYAVWHPPNEALLVHLPNDYLCHANVDNAMNEVQLNKGKTPVNYLPPR